MAFFLKTSPVAFREGVQLCHVGCTLDAGGGMIDLLADMAPFHIPRRMSDTFSSLMSSLSPDNWKILGRIASEPTLNGNAISVGIIRKDN